MKLKHRFTIIVAVTMIQVLLLVSLILQRSSKMQEMKNYQYEQATVEVELANTINLLNQVAYWGFERNNVKDVFTEKVSIIGEKYAFISTDKILRSFPDEFVQSLSQQIMIWNALSSKFSLVKSALQVIQDTTVSSYAEAIIASDGIRKAAEKYPDEENLQKLVQAAEKIDKQMESILRSGKRLSTLNSDCADKIINILSVKEKANMLFSIIMAIFSCILMGILILLVTRGITRRIEKIRDMTSILASKDFTVQINPEGSNEMKSLMININNMVDKINDFFIVVKTTASKAISSGYVINDSANNTAMATTKIDNNLDQINNEFDEITNSIQVTIDAISDMNDHVQVLVENNEKQTSAIEESNNAVNGAATTLEYINQMAMARSKSAEEMHDLVADGDSKINQTNSVLNEITSQLDKVRQIVTIINKVSAKTNLLSMNAGIEAAHAGEAGKGFGVVASEIRKLAEETSKNAILIEGVVKAIVDSVSEANATSAAASTAFIRVRDNADQIIKSLQEITNGVGSIDNQMHQIKEKSELTACAADEINTYCTNLALRQKEVSEQVDSMNALFLNTKESISQIKKGTGDIVSRISKVRDSSKDGYKNMTDLENVLEEFKTKNEVDELVKQVDEENAIDSAILENINTSGNTEIIDPIYDMAKITPLDGKPADFSFDDIDIETIQSEEDFDFILDDASITEYEDEDE